MFWLPKQINRRHALLRDGLRVQKEQTPLAPPKSFSQELESPQNCSSPLKIKATFVCLAMSMLTSMSYQFGGTLLWMVPNPIPRSRHGQDAPRAHLPIKLLDRSQFMLSGWLQSVNQTWMMGTARRIPSQAHLDPS